jgi:hypothetical protein
MNLFFSIYLTFWIVACLAAAILYAVDRNSYALSHLRYWHFLFAPWKVITFLIAAIGLTVIAPYTGDPTWDYFDAMFMSLFTFFTAPWAIGALYKTLRRELPLRQAYVAACIWMFSASWSYDLYLLIRDGYYPLTWFYNIFASSVLYVSAGLLWNLDWREGRGVIFSFMESGWPVPSSEAVRVLPRILWFALPLMVLVAFLIVMFVWV